MDYFNFDENIFQNFEINQNFAFYFLDEKAPDAISLEIPYYQQEEDKIKEKLNENSEEHIIPTNENSASICSRSESPM